MKDMQKSTTRICLLQDLYDDIKLLKLKRDATDDFKLECAREQREILKAIERERKHWVE